MGTTDTRICFTEASLHRAHRGWIVRIPTTDGRVFEYPYRSARAARYFLEVFRMKPTWFPAPHRVRPMRAVARIEFGSSVSGSADPVPDPELAEAVDAAFDALHLGEAGSVSQAVSAGTERVSSAEFDAAWAAAFPGSPQAAADDSAAGYSSEATRRPLRSAQRG